VYDDRMMCVIREQVIMQMFMAWSRLTRGWGQLGILVYFV